MRRGSRSVGIFNPISEEHWIKTSVFDNEELKEVDSNCYHPVPGERIPISEMRVNEKGNLVIMKTNYLDNIYIVGKWRDGKFTGGFVDRHTIDDFEKDKIEDPNYYRIYGMGEWGKLRTGGEFWKHFNRFAELHSG